MSGKNTNLYRCHYFLKVSKDSWNGSFDFMATTDERAKKHARAWIREKNKRNSKLIEEKKIERSDWETFSFQHVDRISIEPAEKETPV